MDTLSHGLWGGATFGGASRKTFLLAFVCGAAPDVLSFGPTAAGWVLRGFPGDRKLGEPPDPASIPSYVHHLYNVTHSLLLWALAFLALWLVMGALKKSSVPPWPFVAWAFHILLDIPTHTTAFFPTPYLWPFSTPYVNGVHWATPWVLLTNWTLLLAALAIRWRRGRAVLLRLK